MKAAGEQRVRRVTLGALANVLSQVLNSGGQMLVVPVLLAGWGKQLYGEWLALSAAAASLAVLDLGMQSYVVNRLNQCHALGSKEDYARILQSGILFSAAVANIAALAIAPALWLFPLERWLKLSEETHAQAAWIGVLIVLQVLYAIPYGLLNGVYRSIDEYPRGQMINNGRLLLSLAGTVAAVWLGGGPSSVAAAQVAALVVAGGFIVWDIKRRHPEIPLGFRLGEFRLAFSFIAPSASFLGIQMVAALVVQGSTLLVNGLFGAALLVSFSTSRTLSNLIRQVGATIQNAVWPEFTALEAQQRIGELQRVHMLTSKIVMLSATCAAVYVMVYGDVILRFWTRGQVAYDAWLMTGFMLLTASRSMWLTSSILLSATNRQKTVFAATLACAGVGLPLGYALSFRFGLTGLVLGLAIADAAFCSLWLPATACRAIGESLRRYAVEVGLRSMALFALAFEAARLLRRMLPDPGFDVARLLVGAAIVALISIVVAYTVAINRTERTQANRLLARLLASSLARRRAAAS
jgi:O-antigen/teichoic acid export membrane protein